MVKSSIQTSAKKDTTYPCLKQSVDTNAIVLFTSHSSGTLVHRGTSINPIGYHTDSWASFQFKMIDIEVRLTNSD